MAASLFKWFSAIFLTALAGTDVSTSRTNKEAHPLYITVVEITHNSKDRILEISCKAFTSDLETVLEKMTKTKVDLSSAADKKSTDKWIETYVEKHLQLKSDGKPVQLHFVGSEKEEDGTWSFFQVNDITSVKKIDVFSNLLYDSFDQEINILHVTVGGDRKSFRLDCPATDASFQF